MEKLQAALQKAREKREIATAQAVNSTEPERGQPEIGGTNADQIPDPDLLDQRWEQLPALEITTRQGRRNRLFLDGTCPEATYFDKLRTKVLQQCRDNGWRRLIITSATKACGKTTVASNLAASFTRQRDRRVLLLEFDMRRPELARVFRHQPACGLSDVLEEQDDFASCAARLGTNVAIAMNRAPRPNPAELLLRDRTPEILDAIEGAYAPDLVIFDAPPLLATDDTLAFLKHVDCALIIAAAERTTTEQIDVVEKEIAEQTSVMGVILNRCIYIDDRESYYGYQ